MPGTKGSVLFVPPMSPGLGTQLSKDWNDWHGGHCFSSFLPGMFFLLLMCGDSSPLSVVAKRPSLDVDAACFAMPGANGNQGGSATTESGDESLR
jgi:hypothetical protein